LRHPPDAIAHGSITYPVASAEEFVTHFAPAMRVETMAASPARFL
jgi:hypothetical protein